MCIRDRSKGIELNREPDKREPLLFKKIESLSEEVKKAVKVSEDSDYSLFELPVKEHKRKERWISEMSLSKTIDQKEKATKEQERNAKEWRSKMIEKSRRIPLEGLKEGKVTRE
eukprot:TRINITY_DN14382_c0_g2_i5.p1 TRINITY_DN14382_c0_g2~~TRINITY_DN14382_c0_g2_i5.p1  ORF type:complete len:114 (+),score=21.20 TRINITY_DN14382_c0_g2_i5:69-410(+)